MYNYIKVKSYELKRFISFEIDQKVCSITKCITKILLFLGGGGGRFKN